MILGIVAMMLQSGEIVDGAGSAAGVGAASGVGAKIAAAAGLAAGIGAANADGEDGAAISSGAGSAIGAGAAAATASATAASPGSSTGAGAASATGEAITPAVGAAAGAGAGAAVGAAIVADPDPNYADLALRLTFTASSYDDTSPNTATATQGGTPSIVSGAFNSSGTGGSGDWLTLPTNADFNLGGAATPWTIEFYLQTSAADADPFGMIHITNTAENATSGWAILGAGDGKLIVFLPGFGGTLNFLKTTADYNDGAWHHWALVHEADGDYRWYIDGVADTVWAAGVGTDWITSAIGNKVQINRTGSGTASIAGDFDDIRVYQNFAKYTAGFTPDARST